MDKAFLKFAAVKAGPDNVQHKHIASVKWEETSVSSPISAAAIDNPGNGQDQDKLGNFKSRR